MFESLDIVVLDKLKDRIETGPVQFGSDWPGLFVRGDDALVLERAIVDVVRFLGTLPLDATKPLMRQIGLLAQLGEALDATQR